MSTEADKKAAAAKAETRLASMFRGRRQLVARVVDVPLTTPPGEAQQFVKVRLEVISNTDIGWCHSEAWHHLNDVLRLDPSRIENRQLFQDEIITRVLFRAVRDPITGEPLAESVADLRDSTTADERAAMWEAFYDYQQGIDPLRSDMNEELKEQIDDLVKKKDATQLAALGSSLLASFLISTASPPASSPTPRSGSTET